MNSHSRDSLEPLFLSGKAGRVFALYRSPAAGLSPKGVILYIPPFAEEMNKSRRQVSLFASQMASLGYGTLSIDLFGTGDSEGDFVDARWEVWLDDLSTGCAWLQQRGFDRITIWGLRLGVLLACDFATKFDRERVERLLLWQPVISGKQSLTQFLRLRTAADMISGEDKVTTAELRAQFAAGQTVEVAGYELHPDLVRSIDQKVLAELPPGPDVPASWIEVSARQGATVGPAAARVIERWRELGSAIDAQALVGEPFWTTPEIATVPELAATSARVFGADGT